MTITLWSRGRFSYSRKIRLRIIRNKRTEFSRTEISEIADFNNVRILRSYEKRPTEIKVPSRQGGKRRYLA